MAPKWSLLEAWIGRAPRFAPIVLPGADDDTPWSLWLVWSGVTPRFTAIAPSDGGVWILGRDTPGIDDDRVSRRHCEVSRGAAGWLFADLGSVNGTHVDRRRLDTFEHRARWGVLQLGRSLVIPLPVDGARAEAMIHVEGAHVGPDLRPAWEALRGAAERRRDVLLVGRPGSTSRGLVEHYLRSLGGGQLTATSFAVGVPELEVPAGVVWVTGLDDPRAYVRHPWIEALRRRSDVRLCLEVLAWDRGSLRGDLEVPEGFEVVVIPSIEARPEEIPWWVVDAARSVDPALGIDVTLVEACLDERWPDGLRELVDEVRDAARRARAAGRSTVAAKDVRRWSPAASTRRHRARRPRPELRDRERFTALYELCHGDPELMAAVLRVPAEAVMQWIRRHRPGGPD
ncbi:MAG: FHA domain-containing protein [Nannocystaceae bacterium]